VIHGDFHPWNIHFEEETSLRVLDRSRGRFGDPADDVAALSVNYVFFALRTRGAFSGPFAELFVLFWERYLAASADDELAGVLAPYFAFRALVLANPLWYPEESENTRRLLWRFLFGVLEAERFDPSAIPVLLSRERP
jgi:aminoglycoside phosphotransferase (APT) family kinase protein